MAAPNIIEAETITGRVVTVTLGASATDIIVNDSASGKVLRLGGLIVANPTVLAMPLTLSLVNDDPAHTAALVSDLIVPAGGSLSVPLDKFNLEEGDKITGSGADLHATASFEEIS
ncbi:hypothetical protein ACFPLB_04390 [Aquamicrobium segne]|uniref:Uncharacterized protein n=1 Tax=Aquamicrobium segne TaxID=469547 RepID=A0ABW0GVS8_9HYPH